MEWINIEDRFPKKYSRVLVFKINIAMHCYGISFYNGKDFLFDATMLVDDKNFESISDKKIKGITHWMPLTQP